MKKKPKPNFEERGGERRKKVEREVLFLY